jgi:sec-independent protein translocase protein TatB
MFDIGFSEIVLIAVVALIVIGPERLPKTAKTLGLLFGRLQRYVSDVKADINRELELEELRKLQHDVQSAAKDIETTMSNAARDVESGTRKLESELNAAPETAPSPPSADVSAPVPAAASTEVPTDPATQSAPDAAAATRQASLPGFERG